jgi:hypothetical protein
MRPEVLAISQTSKYLIFAKVQSKQVFDQKVVIFDLNPLFAFPVLQSRVHEVWANLMGSSMKDDPVYTQSDCFDTFPMPSDYLENQSLKEFGEVFYNYRKRLLVERGIGLTALYNLFHSPSCLDPEIIQLRDLQFKMDELVINSYGWTDLKLETDFVSAYGESEDSYSIRLSWSDDLRDKVLARLIEENSKRPERQGASDGDDDEN